MQDSTQGRTQGDESFSLRGPVPMTVLGRCATAVVRAVEASGRTALISRHGAVMAELSPCPWSEVVERARGGELDIATIDDRSVTMRDLSRDTSAVLADVAAGHVRFVKRRSAYVARLAPLSTASAAVGSAGEPPDRESLSPAGDRLAAVES